MFHAGLYEEDGGYGENTMDNRRLIAFWEQRARLPPNWLHGMTEKTCFVGELKGCGPSFGGIRAEED